MALGDWLEKQLSANPYWFVDELAIPFDAGYPYPGGAPVERDAVGTPVPPGSASSWEAARTGTP